MFAKKELSCINTPGDIKNIEEQLIEEGLTLLGVTGLEDLLQDNVKECITDFRNAQIKVWMLTGDKGETAHNIGISCGLIDEHSQNIFKLDNPNKTQLIHDLKNIKS